MYGYGGKKILKKFLKMNGFQKAKVKKKMMTEIYWVLGK